MMTAERAKQIAFCALQLLRQQAVGENTDWKDYDDWLFSELDIELPELEEIYAPYPEVLVHGRSCYQPNESPKDYDRKYFLT